MAVNLHTTHYRFGVDELAESTHGWHANLDTNPAKGVIAVDATFLLRFTLQETGGTAAGNVDMQFQYNRNGAGWTNVTTTSSVVKAVAAAALTNGGNCTKRLTGTGTFESSGAGQTEDGLAGGNNNDIAASGNSETECGLQLVGADVADGDTIEFRLTSPDFTVTNDVVPTLTVAKPVAGTLDATEPADTFAADGTVASSGVSGDLTATEAVDTLAGAGEVLVAGALATTEAADALAGDGQVLLAGDLGAVESSDIFVGEGYIRVAGDLIVTEAADVLALTGSVEGAESGYAHHGHASGIIARQRRLGIR